MLPADESQVAALARLASREAIHEGFTHRPREWRRLHRSTWICSVSPRQLPASAAVQRLKGSTTSMDRVEITDELPNWENWGKLIKTWATGTNRFNDGNDWSPPKSLAELQSQLKRAQVTMHIPDRFKNVRFEQDLMIDDTLVIRLPAKELIEEAEARLGAASGKIHYPLPVFYDPVWAMQGRADFPADEILRIHSRRIGEYTIRNCQ
jgi:hypothetical protein